MTHEKRETKLCAELLPVLKKRLSPERGFRSLVINIADRANSGYADISIDVSFMHVWLELKLADPDFKSRGVQELFMLRAALCAHAFYVIYALDARTGNRRTHIVTPSQLKTWDTHDRHVFSGHAHDDVANFVADIVERGSY